MLLEENNYYWVHCELIDDIPVVAEYVNNVWYFCGFENAILDTDVDVVAGPILLSAPN